METTPQKDTLLLVDANSLIHRAFHALPPFTAPDGSPAGALYGLASILIKIFNERPPKYIAAAFDRPEPTFRHKEYSDYKGTRATVADELISQLQKSRDLLENFGVPHFEKAGWEADDIVITIAKRYENEKNLKITILSGDLDTLQAVRDNSVVVESPKKGISNTVIYDKAAVMERFGVPPENLADYKGLVGDTSDNIPGVPGIGPKTAATLLSEYKTIENMFEDIKEVGMSNIKLREKLLEFESQARLSKKLAILDENVPLNPSLKDLEANFLTNKIQVKDCLNNLGFESLVTRIENST